MTEIQLKADGFDSLTRKLEKSPKVIAEAKRQAFAEAAPQMKRIVDVAIGGTGKVQSWQEQYVGSAGGYAAVRPLAKTFTEVNGKGKRYAVGHVTNAVNSGHNFPTPSGKNARYRPRIRSGRQKVAGRYFYQMAQDQVPQIAEKVLRRVEETLQEHFEG